MSRRALLAAVTAVAIIFALGGWFAGSRIKSPAEIAAEQAPPKASLITVPVEEKELSQNVVVRGTVEASDSTDVEATSVAGTNIITKINKEVGSNISEGNVIIEVAGRPIFGLQGELPVFRDLVPGLEGPDVKQLEQSLKRLGYSPGTVDGVYTASTASAVERLYRSAGYKPNEPTNDDLSSVRTLRESVTFAEDSLAEAEQALKDASLNSADKAELDKAVTDAEAALKEAEALEDEELISIAKNDLTQAKQARTSALNVDTSQLVKGVDRAKSGLVQAKSNLSDLQSRVGSSFPSAELRFFQELPQKVRSVDTKVGQIPSGAAMSVTGSDLSLESSVASSDRRLVKVGDVATVSDDNLGISFQVKVISVGDTASNSGRYQIKFEPVDEIPEDAIGVSMKITIPVLSSGGKVLAVPLAALFNSGDGVVRVEVERQDGSTDLVEVKPGLKSEGFVQVDVISGSLKVGDRLIVGRDLELPGTTSDEDSES